MTTPTTDWEEDVRSGAVLSNSTRSGLEVVFDPEYVISFIRNLLTQQKEEIRGMIENARSPFIDTNLTVGFDTCKTQILSALEGTTTSPTN